MIQAFVDVSYGDLDITAVTTGGFYIVTTIRFMYYLGFKLLLSSLLVLISGVKRRKKAAVQDAKTLFKAIQARFGGNDATKKTQRTLLKQMYENFSAPSTKSLESIFNRLQKIVSQLAILGENISQEDLNIKFLRSLPSEWNTHVVVWRNKADLDTISIDDLYKNSKLLNKKSKERLPQAQAQDLKTWPFFYLLAVLMKNQDSSRKTVNVEDTSSKAMVAIDGTGFDWSYMDDDEVPTNMALMAFSDSKMVQKPVLKIVEKGTVQRGVRPVWNNEIRTNHQNFSNSRRNFAPTAVLTKSRIVPISTAGQSSSREATPVSAARPINTAASKPLGNKVVSNVGKQGINDVKSSTCWVWRPKIKVQDHVSKNSGSYICKQFDYVDPEGRLKQMKENISYLADFKKHNGGNVAFRGGAKGGKIIGKGTIRTGKLDFKDVYFVKELQFNLFSVSQMCDKKNSVLFTDAECFVLSPNFKLADESQVLLKVPRKNNMYSFDMKNIVP
nr:ribonuclease H-like domain-containing protein [Tanacetum cinerariifolium]